MATSGFCFAQDVAARVRRGLRFDGLVDSAYNEGLETMADAILAGWLLVASLEQAANSAGTASEAMDFLRPLRSQAQFGQKRSKHARSHRHERRREAQ